MLLSRLCGIAAAASVSAVASAGFINIASNSALSTESLGGFTGSLDWNFLGGHDGVLTVSLTNTSPLANGGFLVAFVFRSSTTFTSSLSTTSDVDFLNIPAGESGSPFGSYDAGAGLGGSFLGGGNPNPGLAVGASGVFTFAISSASAAALSAESFIGGPSDFLVRFRGFEDGGSDKTPGQIIPTPGAIALLSFAGIVRNRRRR